MRVDCSTRFYTLELQYNFTVLVMATSTFARSIFLISDCAKISSKLFSQVIKSYGHTRTFAVAGIQEKIEVCNILLNVEIVGNGPQKILCLPGGLGSIESDFTPQLQNLNQDKFTIIAWDPPGYGKSRPPNRDLVIGIRKNLENDAQLVHGLMKKLGFDKFSLLGWSDGAITGIFMASLFPESLHKLILLGCHSFVDDQDAMAFKNVRNIDSWTEKMKKPMIDMYGDEYFRTSWAAWMDAYISLNKGDHNICMDKLAMIKCPTFIIHGAMDFMVHNGHPTYLHKHIKNSKLFIMENGKHNLHLRYPEKINAMIETFLLDN